MFTHEVNPCDNTVLEMSINVLVVFVDGKHPLTLIFSVVLDHNRTAFIFLRLLTILKTMEPLGVIPDGEMSCFRGIFASEQHDEYSKFRSWMYICIQYAYSYIYFHVHFILCYFSELLPCAFHSKIPSQFILGSRQFEQPYISHHALQ